MVDLTAEMVALWGSLGPAPQHRARIVLVSGGGQGSGASTVARELARLAAVSARKPVWLVDADVERQPQLAAITAQPERYGKAGDVVAGSPDGSCFFAVTPVQAENTRPARLLTARSFMGRRLYVTSVDSSRLAPGQRIQILGQADYWAALSRHADTIVIDASVRPSLQTVEALAPISDCTLLVLKERDDVRAALGVQQAIEAAGGRVHGLILNQSTRRV